MAPEPKPEKGDRDTVIALARAHDGLRTGLIGFFQRHRVPDPDELANEVFLRVLQKLQRGLRIRRSVEQYCWRVARFVLLEQFRRRRFSEMPRDLSNPGKSIGGLEDMEADVLLKQCMEILTARDFEFFQRYIQEDRKELARELDTTTSALATRFCKLKQLIVAFGQEKGSSR